MIYFHFTPGSPQSPNTDRGFGKRQSSLQHEEGEVSSDGRRRKKGQSTVTAWVIAKSHHSCERGTEQ